MLYFFLADPAKPGAAMVYLKGFFCVEFSVSGCFIQAIKRHYPIFVILVLYGGTFMIQGGPSPTPRRKGLVKKAYK